MACVGVWQGRPFRPFVPILFLLQRGCIGLLLDLFAVARLDFLFRCWRFYVLGSSCSGSTACNSSARPNNILGGRLFLTRPVGLRLSISGISTLSNQ